MVSCQNGRWKIPSSGGLNNGAITKVEIQYKTYGACSTSSYYRVVFKNSSGAIIIATPWILYEAYAC